MKIRFLKLLGFITFLFALAISFAGCAEQRYYDNYHHHSREWYDHHHEPPPAGVNFELEVH